LFYGFGLGDVNVSGRVRFFVCTKGLVQYKFGSSIKTKAEYQLYHLYIIWTNEEGGGYNNPRISSRT